MLNKKKLLILIVALIVLSLGVFFLVRSNASASHSYKLTVCHKTHSDSNPWVIQTIKANELESHLANGDFLVNADHVCPPVSPTPTIGEPTVTPTPICGSKWEEDCITPTPTASPEATPTPNENQGEGVVPDGNSSTTNAPGSATCTIPFDAPKLQGFSADGNGSVTFSWWGVNSVDKYSIRYGYKPNELVYGEDNIPSSSTSITLNGLTPGSNVWAIVSSWKNGCAEDSNLLDPKVK